MTTQKKAGSKGKRGTPTWPILPCGCSAKTVSVLTGARACRCGRIWTISSVKEVVVPKPRVEGKRFRKGTKVRVKSKVTLYRNCTGVVSFGYRKKGNGWEYMVRLDKANIGGGPREIGFDGRELELARGRK